MIAKSTRILTVVSCRKMHDHGGVSVLWTYDDDDPFALTVHPEGTDQFWQVDRLDFSRTLASCVSGIPAVSGVASMQLRLSDPSALSLRFTEYTPDGERHTYLLCHFLDVDTFLDDVNAGAPQSFRQDVDAALGKIFNKT